MAAPGSYGVPKYHSSYAELNCDGEFVDGGLDYVTAKMNAFRLVVA